MGGKCIGPRDHWSQKIFGVARKYFKFQKQTRVYWPDINVNFVWAENILSLRMTKTDALINWTPPPHTHTLEKCGGYMGNDSGFCNEPPPRRGDFYSLAGSLLFM